MGSGPWVPLLVCMEHRVGVRGARNCAGQMALLSKTCLGRKAVLKSWGSREAYLGCVWV